jgi:hypothetical protein
MTGRRDFKTVSIKNMKDLAVGKVLFSYRITMIQFGFEI